MRRELDDAGRPPSAAYRLRGGGEPPFADSGRAELLAGRAGRVGSALLGGRVSWVRRGLMTESGLVIVDKPGGMTSHDVVARIRRLAHTRRVGHAGTLDPMATGVLLIGVEKATRLLGHLALAEKEYAATIRLGQSTVTDDAEGGVVPPVGAAISAIGAISEPALRAAMHGFTGEISQVPPRISAIKVGGQRAYRLTRAGAAPELAARTVTIRRFDLLACRQPGPGLLDVDVAVTCSSGTYIRAIARDLGADLGVGGHLTALRRTRVGQYGIGSAKSLDQLADRFEVLPLAQAARAAFPRIDLTADETRRVAHGASLAAVPVSRVKPASARVADAEPAELEQVAASGPVGAFGPDGGLVALLAVEDGQMRPIAVFVP